MSNFTEIVNKKVSAAIDKYSMLENTDKIIVGFSGGADSVCLIHVLNNLKNKLSFSVKAVHINHGIRGNEAKRDEDFCVSFCEKYDIPIKVSHFNCLAEARKSKESLEECGRRLRYASFQNEADFSTRIATAHNANDNSETVFFNLSRGASLKGVCGIPPVRGNIVRPLIFCSRYEIEGYCEENNLKYVTDSTNLQDEYARNKIRHNIIPVLQEINSASVSNITSFCEDAKDIYNYISSKAKNALEKAFLTENTYDVTVLRALDKVVLKEAIIKAYSSFSDNSLSRVLLGAIVDLVNSNGRCGIYGDECAEVIKGKLRFYHRAVDSIIEQRLICGPGEYAFGSYSVDIAEFTDYSKNINKKLLDNLIDCDTINGNLFLRTRMEGDEFTLYKRNVTKSLKKLFNELSVPVEERDKLPVLCDDDGIVWIYSIGVCKRCHITDYSSNIICVKGENNG